MLTLVLEDVFTGDTLGDCARARGHRVLAWDDDWWRLGLPDLEGRVVFRGSLENADRVARAGVWSPGSWCNTEGFRCTRWMPGAAAWSAQRDVRFTTVRELVARPPTDLGERVFVRPDSPLKPFSGRVVEVDGLTAAHLDHGFYYEDLDLPVMVAAVRTLGREWRYVVVNGQVVAGSGYAADGRTPGTDSPAGEPWRVATSIASRLALPDPVAVLDLVEVEGALELLELNPFSGADLYACDRGSVLDSLDLL